MHWFCVAIVNKHGGQLQLHYTVCSFLAVLVTSQKASDIIYKIDDVAKGSTCTLTKPSSSKSGLSSLWVKLNVNGQVKLKFIISSHNFRESNMFKHITAKTNDRSRHFGVIMTQGNYVTDHENYII